MDLQSMAVSEASFGSEGVTVVLVDTSVLVSEGQFQGDG
jgi:hypothetical protein